MAIGPYSLLDRQIVVETNSERFATSLERVLTDLRSEERPGNPTTFLVRRKQGPTADSSRWEVWRDGVACETMLRDHYVADYVLWELTRLLLESCEPLLPIHAAAVSSRGQGVILAGGTHAGKSTLSAWLTVNGWGFLTDEVALVGSDGKHGHLVHPFWRPIGVRPGSPIEAFLEVPQTADSLLVPASRLGALSHEVPLRAIVLVSYSPTAEPLITREPRPAAIRKLAEHLPTLRAGGSKTFRRLVELAREIPAYSMTVNDLRSAGTQLDDLVKSNLGGNNAC